MEGTQSVFLSMKEVLKLVGLGRAHVDRLRRQGLFPDSYELTGAPRGKIGFLRHEVLEWLKNRRKRVLRPLA